MEKQEQINELANIMFQRLNEANFDDVNDAAVEIYEKGNYRKQSQSEWIMSPDGIKPMTCSKCGMPALFEITKNQFADTEIVRVPSKFCPHCGKAMKNADKK